MTGAAGVAAMTSMLMMNVSLPDALVAVTVWFVADVTAVGVPEILPVLEVKPRPVGRAGLIDQPEAGPPTFVGISAAMATDCVKVTDAFGYEMSGAASDAVTVMLITNVSDPAEFVAVTV